MDIEVESITLGVGNLIVVNNVSLRIPSGRAIALLGPNGAGKTTFCKGLIGTIKPISGHIRVNGNDVTSLPTHARTEMGFTYVPERGGVLEKFTIEENLMVGAVRKKARDKLDENLELAYNIFPWLKSRKKEKVSNLSGGQRQILSLMRALMNEPGFLILDEPSQGLSPANVKIIYHIISSVFIKEKRIPIFIAEQIPTYLIDIVEQTHLMSSGRIIATISDELIENQEYVWELLTGGE
jgi:branched-chain amino acid transport system ATP-binding protein